MRVAMNLNADLKDEVASMKNEFKSNVDELREMYQSIMHDEIENMISDNFAEARKKKLKA
jgi:hypothetical protein